MTYSDNCGMMRISAYTEPLKSGGGNRQARSVPCASAYIKKIPGKIGHSPGGIFETVDLNLLNLFPNILYHNNPDFSRVSPKKTGNKKITVFFKNPLTK